MKKQFPNKLDEELINAVKEAAKVLDISANKLLKMALTEFIKKVGIKY